MKTLYIVTRCNESVDKSSKLLTNEENFAY